MKAKEIMQICRGYARLLHSIRNRIGEDSTIDQANSIAIDVMFFTENGWFPEQK